MENTKNYETLIYYGRNYGTVEKTLVLWKKRWYYGNNYGTMEGTIIQ